VIENERLPRDKVCGDARTYRAIPLVQDVFPELKHLTPSASFTTREVLVYPDGHRLRRESA
jgi:hypothetical protein